MSIYSRKRDKRQWLLLHLKRVLRQRWFFKLVINVIWKIVDHFTR